MVTTLAILSFILGSILGSFLLVVALRYNTGKSLGGRSACFSCSTQLHWYELVPVVSFLLQRGRCRTCGSLIPQETVISELAMGVVVVLLSLRGLLLGQGVEILWSSAYLIGTLFLILIFSILAVVFIYDLHHKIIPDRLSLAFAIITLIGSFFFSFETGHLFRYVGFHVPTLFNLLGGILVPLPFYLIWKFSGGRLIGLGDPKLMVGMGFLFGTLGGYSAVFVSFWIGTLFILALLVIERVLHLTLFQGRPGGIMKQEVPFGPFLVVGTLLSIVLAINLW